MLVRMTRAGGWVFLMLLRVIQTKHTSPVRQPNVDVKEDALMSKPQDLKPGNYVEPVVFEPQPKIRLSRSTYKIHSYVDFAPYKIAFKTFGRYLDEFRHDLSSPEYVGSFANVRRRSGTEIVKYGKNHPFHEGNCRDTYKCRVRKQYEKLLEETDRIEVLYKNIHRKFLNAIDHIGYHPTAQKKGRKKSKKHQSDEEEILKERHFERQIQYLTPQDVESINEGTKVLKKRLGESEVRRRKKRFGLVAWAFGWGLKKIFGKDRMQEHLYTLQKQNELQQGQILELSHYLNVTHVRVSENRGAINDLYERLAVINKTLLTVMDEARYLRYTTAFMTDSRIILSRLMIGIMTLKENVETIYEYMRVLATRSVNPLLMPPNNLRAALQKIQEDIRPNPRLLLPEDPQISIWNYYSIMRITPVILEDFLMIILTIPLADRTLRMDIYKVHNLPALYPAYKLQFKYKLEGEYLAISKDGVYAALPTSHDIRVCETTEGYLCPMNQALYPVEKIEWCLYALFTQDKGKVQQYCIIEATHRRANRAQSLGGYLWAVSTLKNEKLQVRCLVETHIEDIIAPLTIVNIGDGCEAYSSSIYIPAKTELTSRDDELVRHVHFLKFNDQYQDITRYSMIEAMHFETLTQEENETLANRLTALPPLTFNQLKERLKLIPPPKGFNIKSTVLFFIFLVVILLIVGAIALVVWRVYRVRSSLKNIKPLARMFMDGSDNIPMGMQNIRQLLGLIKPRPGTINQSRALPTPPPVSPRLVHAITDGSSSDDRPGFRNLDTLSTAQYLDLSGETDVPTKITKVHVQPLGTTTKASITETDVKDALKEMGYRPSAVRRYRKYLAKQLAGLKSSTVIEEN